jgi:hypothetical protein
MSPLIIGALVLLLAGVIAAVVGGVLYADSDKTGDSTGAQCIEYDADNISTMKDGDKCKYWDGNTATSPGTCRWGIFNASDYKSGRKPCHRRDDTYIKVGVMFGGIALAVLAILAILVKLGIDHMHRTSA